MKQYIRKILAACTLILSAIVGVLVFNSEKEFSKENMHHMCIETLIENAPTKYREDNSYLHKVKVYCDCYIEKYFDEIDLDTKTFKRFPNLNKKDEAALDAVLNEIDKGAIDACLPLILEDKTTSK